jgi:hypothetical protein
MYAHAQVVTGNMMSISELTIFDTDGNMLIHPNTTVSAVDCEATAHPGSNAVDNDNMTKWLCDSGTSATSFQGAQLTIAFDTKKTLHSYQITAADDIDTNPTSWTLTCTASDGTEVLMSTVEDTRAPEEAYATYSVISLLPAPLTPPSPPAPPAPPSHPPGTIVAEVCELTITAVSDGGNTAQLAEVVLYDKYGEAMTIVSASSGCAPDADTMGAAMAVDGDISTTWKCSGFGAVCGETCWYASDGGCDLPRSPRPFWQPP